MDAFFSISGARETFASAVRAAKREDWKLVDSLSLQLADSTAQGDFNVVYGAVYAVYQDTK